MRKLKNNLVKNREMGNSGFSRKTNTLGQEVLLRKCVCPME